MELLWENTSSLGLEDNLWQLGKGCPGSSWSHEPCSSPTPALRSFFNPGDKSDKKKNDTVSPPLAAHSLASSTCCLRSPVSKWTGKGVEGGTAEEWVCECEKRGSSWKTCVPHSPPQPFFPFRLLTRNVERWGRWI